MRMRRLAELAGLFCVLLGAVACDSTATPSPVPLATPTVALALTASPVPPTTTALVASPTSALPAPTIPVAPTATALPATATAVPPPATPTAVVLSFDAGLDPARLDTLYTQAAQLVNATAPDAKLSYVRLDLVAFASPALVQFDFYTPNGPQFLRAQAVDGSAFTVEKLGVPNPAPATFDPLPWVRNPGWPSLLGAALAQAKLTPDPAHGLWRFSLEAHPGGPDWQVALTAATAYQLASGKVSEQPARAGQTPGPAVPASTADVLPLDYSLNNAAVDRYYRAALRLLAPKTSDANLRALEIRLGDPVDAGEDTILYHFYSVKQKQDYLATFDIGGRRDITPQSLPAGTSRTLYRESTLPWKTVPTWTGLAQVAAQSLTGQPLEHTRLLLAAHADAPALWTATASIVYQFTLRGETVTNVEP